MHILLRLITKHHHLLELELHIIDKEIADNFAMASVKLGESLFDKHIEGIRKYQRLLGDLGYRKSEKESGMLTKSKAKTLDTLIASLTRQVQKGRPTELHVQSGPLVSELGLILKRSNIAPQAYHSRSLNGNHCAKFITEKVQYTICSGLQEKVFHISEISKDSKFYPKFKTKWIRLF